MSKLGLKQTVPRVFNEVDRQHLNKCSQETAAGSEKGVVGNMGKEGQRGERSGPSGLGALAVMQ